MPASPLFNRYVFKHLAFTTFIIAMILAIIILLTQSLKFLELIIDSGASAGTFWVLAFLALPRFFEVILPMALMIATIFVYNRMIGDSEVVVMRAAGTSPMSLARPALVLGLLVTFILLFITSWLAPATLENMQKMRQVIKTQYSTLLFREGVFNTIGDDLTVYIENRNAKGELEGLMIHDSRAENPAPVTVIAKRGVIVATDEGQQVLVYDGSRQDFNAKTGALNRLNFERYTIDLPEAAAIRNRQKKPDEQTIFELVDKIKTGNLNADENRAYQAEINRRFASPFLALSFTSLVLCCLLLGPLSRRGQSKRITLAVGSVIVMQGLYLSIFNKAEESLVALVLMHMIVFIPLLISLFLLSSFGEKIRCFMFSYFRKNQEKDDIEEEAST
jgi:lipopolysaccharide export system permease protein